MFDKLINTEITIKHLINLKFKIIYNKGIYEWNCSI